MSEQGPPKKRFGQHFLKDPNTARIVASGVTKDDVVLEIGPGRGFLTGFLVERAGLVHAIELDPDVLPTLREAVRGRDNVIVYEGDALRLDYSTLVPAPTKLVANLPYNIAATLVLKVLAEAPAIDHQVVMVQREVGERLAAAPGSPAYGAPSAKLAAQATARVLSPVSRHVFLPEPHVDSVLLGVTRRQHPATAGVDLSLRAERLGVEEFAALARQVRQVRNTGHVSRFE